MGKNKSHVPVTTNQPTIPHLLGGLQDVVGLHQIDAFLHCDQVLHRRHDFAEPRVAVGDEVLGWFRICWMLRIVGFLTTNQ